MHNAFGSETHLIELVVDRAQERLDPRAVVKPIVFVFGAALCQAAADEHFGVPGVDDMIRLVEDVVGPIELPSGASSAERYQAAFTRVRWTRSPESARMLVQEAVLRACQDLPAGIGRRLVRPLTESELFDLERKHFNGWYFNRAVDALGSILAQHPSLCSYVLTSNFDPLIECAVRRHGGPCRTIDAGNGDDPTRQSGDGPLVVHFNGWYHADPLHTSPELEERPTAVPALRRALANSTVIVAAYGGWEDVFMKALKEGGGIPGADVHWAFYSPQGDERVCQKLKVIPFPGVTFYGGVDVRRFLPALQVALNDRVAREGDTQLPATGVAPQHDERPDPYERHATVESLVVEAIGHDNDGRAVPICNWALDRGPLTAIVAVDRRIDVWQSLVTAEDVLWVARRAEDVDVRLPTRHWVELRGGMVPLPGDRSELWNSCRAAARSISTTIVQFERLDMIATGIVVAAPSMHAPDTIAGDFGRFLRLLDDWFGAVRPAVVLTVSGDSSNEMQQRVAAIYTALQARYRAAAVQRVSVRDRAALGIEAGMPWARSRLSHAESLAEYLETALPRLPSMLSFVARLREAYEQSLRSSLSAADFVTHMDNFGEAFSPECAVQLLEALHRDMPDVLPDMVTACAGSARPAIRRAALDAVSRMELFGADGRDQLADCWLHGLRDYDFAGLQIHIDGLGLDSISDLVAMAICRRGHRNPTGDLALIDSETRTLLSPSVRRAIMFLAAAEPFEVASPTVWEASRRCGLRPWPSAEQLTTTHLTNSSFWSFLRRLPLDAARVKALLSLESAKRAVFGLCTRTEFEALDGDAFDRQLVNQIRAACSLPFAPTIH